MAIEYTYGGQWFDDMGSLAFAFQYKQQAPVMGWDLARAGLTRAQANDMAKNLMNDGLPGYETLGPTMEA